MPVIVNIGRMWGRSRSSSTTTRAAPSAILYGSRTSYDFPSAMLITNGIPSRTAVSIVLRVIVVSECYHRRSQYQLCPGGCVPRRVLGVEMSGGCTRACFLPGQADECPHLFFRNGEDGRST